MSHNSLTSNTLSIPAHFLLVLLINQHTLNHHTLATLHHNTNTHLTKDITMDTHHLPSSHQQAVLILAAS